MATSTAIVDLFGNETIGSLAGVAGSSVNSNGFTLNTGGNGSSTLFPGDISGVGSVAKSGAGTFTLGGANTYFGDTDIDAGTLALGASGSIFNSGNINLDAGAFLDVTATGGYSLSAGQSLNGTGTVVGNLVVAADSTLAPGNSPGTMNFVGNLDFAADGIYSWEINDPIGTAGDDTGWDLASINGQLSITATASNPFEIKINSLDIFNSPGELAGLLPNTSQVWTIASATGGISGFSQSVFTLNTAGFTSPVVGSFAILLNGNNLNLQFNTVPEPSSLMILGPGMAGLFVRTRKRRLQLV